VEQPLTPPNSLESSEEDTRPRSVLSPKHRLPLLLNSDSSELPTANPGFSGSGSDSRE